MHVMRDGDGSVVYFGEHRGARFVAVDLCGFNGWSSSRRMPGGWEFFNPTLHVGRLFMDCSRHWSVQVLLPASLVRLWRKRKRAYRVDLREQPMEASDG